MSGFAQRSHSFGCSVQLQQRQTAVVRRLKETRLALCREPERFQRLILQSRAGQQNSERNQEVGIGLPIGNQFPVDTGGRLPLARGQTLFQFDQPLDIRGVRGLEPLRSREFIARQRRLAQLPIDARQLIVQRPVPRRLADERLEDFRGPFELAGFAIGLPELCERP
jgi:hypothetical protein